MPRPPKGQPVGEDPVAGATINITGWQPGAPPLTAEQAAYLAPIAGVFNTLGAAVRNVGNAAVTVVTVGWLTGVDVTTKTFQAADFARQSVSNTTSWAAQATTASYAAVSAAAAGVDDVSPDTHWATAIAWRSLPWPLRVFLSVLRLVAVWCGVGPLLASAAWMVLSCVAAACVVWQILATTYWLLLWAGHVRGWAERAPQPPWLVVLVLVVVRVVSFVARSSLGDWIVAALWVLLSGARAVWAWLAAPFRRKPTAEERLAAVVEERVAAALRALAPAGGGAPATTKPTPLTAKAPPPTSAPPAGSDAKATTTAQPAAAQQKPKARAVCRDFAKGNCARANCRFSHEVPRRTQLINEMKQLNADQKMPVAEKKEKLDKMLDELAHLNE